MENDLAGDLTHEWVNVNSEQLKKIESSIQLAAETAQPVLITGEPGTTKRCIAKIIHELSRSKGEFKELDCRTISGVDRVNSARSGQISGDLVGVEITFAGLMKEAGRQTLFLNGIEHLSLYQQAGIMGVFENRTCNPPDEDIREAQDSRLIAAANSGFNELKESGKFRHGFFEKIKFVNIHLPPLLDEWPTEMPESDILKAIQNAYLEARVKSPEHLKLTSVMQGDDINQGDNQAGQGSLEKEGVNGGSGMDKTGSAGSVETKPGLTRINLRKYLETLLSKRSEIGSSRKKIREKHEMIIKNFKDRIEDDVYQFAVEFKGETQDRVAKAFQGSAPKIKGFLKTLTDIIDRTDMDAENLQILKENLLDHLDGFPGIEKDPMAAIPGKKAEKAEQPFEQPASGKLEEQSAQSSFDLTLQKRSTVNNKPKKLWIIGGIAAAVVATILWQIGLDMGFSHRTEEPQQLGQTAAAMVGKNEVLIADFELRDKQHELVLEDGSPGYWYMIKPEHPSIDRNQAVEFMLERDDWKGEQSRVLEVKGELSAEFPLLGFGLEFYDSYKGFDIINFLNKRTYPYVGRLSKSGFKFFAKGLHKKETILIRLENLNSQCGDMDAKINISNRWEEFSVSLEDFQISHLNQAGVSVEQCLKSLSRLNFQSTGSEKEFALAVDDIRLFFDS